MNAPLGRISTLIPAPNMETYLNVPPLGYSAPPGINNIGYLGFNSQIPLTNAISYFNGLYSQSIPICNSNYYMPTPSYYPSVPLPTLNANWSSLQNPFPLHLTCPPTQPILSTSSQTPGTLVAITSSSTVGDNSSVASDPQCSSISLMCGDNINVGNGLNSWVQPQLSQVQQVSGYLPSKYHPQQLHSDTKGVLIGNEHSTNLYSLTQPRINECADIKPHKKASSTTNNSAISTSTASVNSLLQQQQRRKICYANNILYKTVLCKDYKASQERYCPRGESCQFAHGVDDLHIPTGHQLYHTKMCIDLQMSGKCNRGAQCYHAHHPSELKTKSKHQGTSNPLPLTEANQYLNDASFPAFNCNPSML